MVGQPAEHQIKSGELFVRAQNINFRIINLIPVYVCICLMVSTRTGCKIIRHGQKKKPKESENTTESPFDDAARELKPVEYIRTVNGYILKGNYKIAYAVIQRAAVMCPDDPFVISFYYLSRLFLGGRMGQADGKDRFHSWNRFCSDYRFFCALFAMEWPKAKIIEVRVRNIPVCEHMSDPFICISPARHDNNLSCFTLIFYRLPVYNETLRDVRMTLSVF